MRYKNKGKKNQQSVEKLSQTVALEKESWHREEHQANFQKGNSFKKKKKIKKKS